MSSGIPISLRIFPSSSNVNRARLILMPFLHHLNILLDFLVLMKVVIDMLESPVVVAFQLSRVRLLRPCRLQPARLLCSWGFSRQEHWNGLPFLSPHLPDPGIKPACPALQADSLPTELQATVKNNDTRVSPSDSYLMNLDASRFLKVPRLACTIL